MKSQKLGLCESSDLVQASDSDRSERPQRRLTDTLRKRAFRLFFRFTRHKSTFKSDRARSEQKFQPQRSQRVAEGSQFIILPPRSLASCGGMRSDLVWFEISRSPPTPRS